MLPPHLNAISIQPYTTPIPPALLQDLREAAIKRAFYPS
jgi:hypothetical protein